MKEYVLKISTIEEKPINKYYRFIHHNYDRLGLETMYFIDFNYPTVRISDTEEKVKSFIEGLIQDGFKVTQ